MSRLSSKKQSRELSNDTQVMEADASLQFQIRPFENHHFSQVVCVCVCVDVYALVADVLMCNREDSQKSVRVCDCVER